ncbi:taste receptor type 2 member 41-like [Trichosurus vulpecula]|uniref:taste receptor type 2 member 41-like n=1 Tax=Trichosurus vulpecula TaxID=9337 RepID=UPI00186B35D0|nr:taste receptor type 2 member 41-like [Trichosurus vulpecula]
MMGLFTTFAMVLYILFCFLGILANGFIVVVLGREWGRCHRLSPCDMILISLGAARFCLLWLGMIHSFYYFLHHLQYSKEPTHPHFGIYFDFLHSVTFLFVAGLSILFCVKIANFTHPIFLWLKWRVKELVPWFLLVSLLISFIVTGLLFVKNNALYQAFLQGTFSGNITLCSLSRKLEICYFLPLKLIIFSIPCSMFVVSIVLLITSLQRHSWRMQHSANSAQDPRTQAHTRALKLLISFLVLYILSFTSFVIDATFFGFGGTWYWPRQIVIYLSTYVHPFILILGNSQLGGALMKLLLLLKTFWNDKRLQSPI